MPIAMYNELSFCIEPPFITVALTHSAWEMLRVDMFRPLLTRILTWAAFDELIVGSTVVKGMLRALLPM